MRASEFLTENNTKYNEVIELITEKCQPYIDVLRQTNGSPLYRGMKGFADSIVYKVYSPRPDRRSSDTPTEIHNAFNQAFRDEYGYPFRNGIFCTGSQSVAEEYGNMVSVVFPIGDLKFVWSDEIEDLFRLLDSSGDGYSVVTEPYGDDDWKVSPAKVANIVKKSYTDTDLARAINSGMEVMLANDCILISIQTYLKIKGAVFA